MITYIYHYGVGGYCAECSPEHDHPEGNLVQIEEIEVEDPVEVVEP